MVTHINYLKVWNTPDASVLNLVVVGEEVEEPQVDGVKLTMPTLDQTQNFEVESMLEQYGEMVSTKLGRTTDICHTITGLSQPLRTFPNRLASAWKDEFQEEVRTPVKAGTLKSSLSPWSSPMKPDGSVRLCRFLSQ